MFTSKELFERRRQRTRFKLRQTCKGQLRLSVHRSSKHIYAQVIGPDGNRIVASASTLEKALHSGSTGNIEAAALVGRIVAERAVAAGVKSVAFDRSGYKYHGRVKALADAAREAGLEF